MKATFFLVAFSVLFSGCGGLSQEERAAYIRDMEQAHARCQTEYNPAACGDYQQLRAALVADKSIEDL